MESESSDKVERPIDNTKCLTAYAFDPIKDKPVVRSDLNESDYRSSNKSGPGLEGRLERIGNTRGASVEIVLGRQRRHSVCCTEMNLENMVENECITFNPTFHILCKEREVLEVAMLSLQGVGAETLVCPINSR